MDTNFSNYDMFDTLIANNKKARSWTVFWVITLCILAGVIISLVIANSKQKKTIADLSINADYKTRIIDSLKGLIQKDVDKKVDSISNYLTQIDNNIKKIENEPAGNNAGNALQKKNLNDVSNSIQQLNNSVKRIKTDFQKDRVRVFIQYNNKENTQQVNELMGFLKRDDDYFIAPPELINNSFDNIIKLYNYDNEKHETRLREVIAKIFDLPANNIKVIHISSKSDVTKPTIEIWISTSQPQVKQANPAPKS